MSDRFPLVSVSQLTLGFILGKQTFVAVNNLRFDLFPGETFALLGESGCGKSATALGMMRLLPPSGRYLGGQVGLQAKEEPRHIRDVLQLSGSELRQVRGGRMAMIFQEPGTSLNPVLTVGEQIAEVLSEHRGLPSPLAIRQETLSLLSQVGIADPVRCANEYPFQFSGGMKQRVMIALALAGEPDVLIADEPTTALDVTVQAQLLDLLQEIQRSRGMAMLLITHDLGVLARMADRVGVMYAGELIEVAQRENFFAHPRHPYSQALFAAMPEGTDRGQRLHALPGQVPVPLTVEAASPGCRFLPRCSHSQARCRHESPPWEMLPDGREIRCWMVSETLGRHSSALPPSFTAVESPISVQQQRRSAPAVLKVDDLKVHFPIRQGILQRVVGHVRAVDGVSLALEAGRTLALVGESGCGKTTVAKALLQLLPATAGTVEIADHVWLRNGLPLPAAHLRPLRRQIQMVFQDPFSSLNPRMRIGEILAEGLLAMGLVTDRQIVMSTLDRLLEQVGLAPGSLERFPHEFSGGQRQRIAIARALAVQPKVLVCDEPTSALDVSVQAQILNLLSDLQQDRGLAYLFVTHNFAVVRYLADDVAVMYLGRIVEQGRSEDILSNPRHPYTQALLSAVLNVSEVQKPRIHLDGEPPSPAAPPTGCHFHPRCAKATDTCTSVPPEFRAVSTTHRVACYL